MKDTSTTVKDIIKVLISNIISLISSILNGFIVPILLGPINYGYYKIFTLYASYTPLLHFGFNDGMMLNYGGKSINKINKYTFRSNSLFFIGFQLFVSLLILSFSLFITNSFYKILLVLISINSLFQNILQYYQNISQVFVKFDIYSLIIVIQYLALIISVVCVWIYCKFINLYHLNFIIYAIIIISINIILAFWYLYYYRSITFGAHISLLSRLDIFKKYFISGFYMTFGYGISILIFNLDSQFIVKFFSTRIYSVYAFAYSMLSAGLTILNSAASVLLPHLKQQSVKYNLKIYSKGITYISLLSYLSIVGYFPLKIIIYYLLKEYYESLIYFRLLLPGIAVICITTFISNYYYAFNKEKFYFLLSLFILLMTFGLDLLVYLIFKNSVALAITSTIALLINYIVSNYFIVKQYRGVKWVKNLLYNLFMILAFILISGISNLIVGFILYLFVYLLISVFLFKHLIYNLIKMMYYKYL